MRTALPKEKKRFDRNGANAWNPHTDIFGIILKCPLGGIDRLRADSRFEGLVQKVFGPKQNKERSLPELKLHFFSLRMLLAKAVYAERNRRGNIWLQSNIATMVF
jgi:hypothetical protein